MKKIEKKIAASGGNEAKELNLCYKSVVNQFKPNAEICSKLTFITPYWLRYLY